MISFYLIIFLVLSVPTYFVLRWVFRDRSKGSLTDRFRNVKTEYQHDLSELRQDAVDEQANIKRKEKDIERFRKEAGVEVKDAGTEASLPDAETDPDWNEFSN